MKIGTRLRIENVEKSVKMILQNAGRIWIIAIVLALTGTTIEAQLAPKTAKIGFLMSGAGSSVRLAYISARVSETRICRRQERHLSSRAPPISITTGFPH